MGHIQPADLPAGRAWRDVERLISDGAPADVVAGATAVASKDDLAWAAGRASLAEAVRLLALLPEAVTSTDPLASLRALGLVLETPPDPSHLAVALARAMQATTNASGKPDDFDHLVLRSLLGTFAQTLGREPADGPGSFETVRQVAADRVSSAAFGQTAQYFFGRLIAATLASWLDRTLSAHVGPGQRFATLKARSGFGIELDRQSRLAAEIVGRTAMAWHRRTLEQDGTVPRERAADLAGWALAEIIDVLLEQYQVLA